MLRLLRWLCPAHLYEGIVGDLLEEYEMNVRLSGHRAAHWKLAWSVICFLRPGILLRNRFSISYIPGMLRSHFKIAWRTTLRNKSTTLINILGMTTGLGIALMLLFIVRFEYSFDRFHSKIDRLYQIRSYDRSGTASILTFRKALFMPFEKILPRLNTPLLFTDGYPASSGSGIKIFTRKIPFSSTPNSWK